MLQKIINHLKSKPKQLFLVDALGALISAVLLGFVLVQYQPLFGIPADILYTLAAIPCLFAIYDLICYFSLKSNFGIYLASIAGLNIAYCVFSIGVALLYINQIHTLGWIYLVLEVILVCLIAKIEWKIA